MPTFNFDNGNPAQPVEPTPPIVYGEPDGPRPATKKELDALNAGVLSAVTAPKKRAAKKRAAK